MHTIGSRLKVWRGAHALKQADAAAKLGLPGNTYQNYERDVRPPNTKGWESFVSAGINANWLLTGEGPMLLADLQAAPKPATAKPPDQPAIKHPVPAINIDALVQAVLVAQNAAPKGETPAQSIRRGIEFYMFCMDRGLITPEGQGTGYLNKAA